MVDNQIPVLDLNRIINELMSEHCQGVVEVHLEPQYETVANAEPETQPTVEEPVEEERAAKRQRTVRSTKEEEIESDNNFVSVKPKDLWKLISPFSEIIEKRGWECLCAHMVAPRLSALEREFYADMVGMREDSVYVQGVWVPFGHKRINKMFKLRKLKHGSKFKKLVENPNHEKNIDLLTGGQGKWEATRKNPHYSINRGSLTEEDKVWFYFLSSIILPTKHLCAVREQEAIILYALLKGYKMNVGGLIEG